MYITYMRGSISMLSSHIYYANKMQTTFLALFSVSFRAPSSVLEL